MAGDDICAGEVRLGFDPTDRPDVSVSFIGRIRTPWEKGNCPRNITGAREAAPDCRIELNDGYAPALTGLAVGRAVIVMYWMDRARRDLAVQAPCHTNGPRGTFALRSPARPNPLAMATVVITALDTDAGVIGIDAIDCFDATPLVDIKPWIPAIDVPPGV